MGYLRGVVHGAAIGAALALLYAPRRGEETRAELAKQVENWKARRQPAPDQAHEPEERA